VFSVEVRADQRVVARVARGAVGARTPDSEGEQTVLAGQELRFGAPAASAISLQDTERDARLLSRWEKIMGGIQP
jgi:ferric-dicitrate binding protein FerR (iron transport regulator)